MPTCHSCGESGQNKRRGSGGYIEIKRRKLLGNRLGSSTLWNSSNINVGRDEIYQLRKGGAFTNRRRATGALPDLCYCV